MKELTFEEKMLQLEEIVNKLENEQNGLNESIKLYQQAKLLASDLEKELFDANQKIAEIMKKDGFEEYTPKLNLDE